MASSIGKHPWVDYGHLLPNSVQKAKGLHLGGLYTLYAGAPLRVMPINVSGENVASTLEHVKLR